MVPIVHPGRLLKRELAARKLSANRLSLDIGVPSGRITDILNTRRAITADTAVGLGRYFGNSAQLAAFATSSRRRARRTVSSFWASASDMVRDQLASLYSRSMKTS